LFVCSYVLSSLDGDEAVARFGDVSREADNDVRMQAGQFRDGNGYPKPEIRWVKTLLGHGYGGF
jgi:hypothetical protein